VPTPIEKLVSILKTFREASASPAVNLRKDKGNYPILHIRIFSHGDIVIKDLIVLLVRKAIFAKLIYFIIVLYGKKIPFLFLASFDIFTNIKDILI